MNTIKFSHEYYKFPAAYQISKLSQVIVLYESDISDSFRDYDTSFKCGEMNLSTGHYVLPKGKVLLLLLIANVGKGWLWTTIRRWTPEKELYYRSLCGQDVKIEVNLPHK